MHLEKFLNHLVFLFCLGIILPSGVNVDRPNFLISVQGGQHG